MAGKFSDEQWNVLIQRYQKGEEIPDLAKELQVTDVCLYWNFKKRNIILRRIRSAPKKLTEPEKLQIIQMYTQGINMPIIATTINRSGGAICKVLKSRDLLEGRSERNKKRVPLEIRNEAIELYLKGESRENISKKLNISPMLIYLEIKRRGLSRKLGAPGIFSFNTEIKSKILDGYRNGLSVSWLAEVNSCSRDAIEKVLRDANVTFRAARSPSDIYFKDKNNREFFFRSSWEVKTAIWLDNQSIKWDYELQTFDLGESKYIPDFWIYKNDGSLDKIIDVKGYYRPESKRKVKLFKELYSNVPFELWNKRIIKKNKILDISLPDITEDLNKRKPKISNKHAVYIIDEYSKGRPMYSLCKELHHSHESVKELLIYHGINVRTGPESNRLRIPMELRDKAVELYKYGYGCETITKFIPEIKANTLFEELKRRGIPSRGCKDMGNKYNELKKLNAQCP